MWRLISKHVLKNQKSHPCIFTQIHYYMHHQTHAQTCRYLQSCIDSKTLMHIHTNDLHTHTLTFSHIHIYMNTDIITLCKYNIAHSCMYLNSCFLTHTHPCTLVHTQTLLYLHTQNKFVSIYEEYCHQFKKKKKIL